MRSQESIRQDFDPHPMTCSTECGEPLQTVHHITIISLRHEVVQNQCPLSPTSLVSLSHDFWLRRRQRSCKLLHCSPHKASVRPRHQERPQGAETQFVTTRVIQTPLIHPMCPHTAHYIPNN